jgi:hypothetical protein
LKSSLKSQLEAALTQLTEAERELQEAIGAMRMSPRSAKVTVSKLIEGAFDKLHAANAKVLELQKRLIADGIV